MWFVYSLSPIHPRAGNTLNEKLNNARSEDIFKPWARQKSTFYNRTVMPVSDGQTKITWSILTNRERGCFIEKESCLLNNLESLFHNSLLRSKEWGLGVGIIAPRVFLSSAFFCYSVTTLIAVIRYSSYLSFVDGLPRAPLKSWLYIVW